MNRGWFVADSLVCGIAGCPAGIVGAGGLAVRDTAGWATWLGNLRYNVRDSNVTRLKLISAVALDSLRLSLTTQTHL